MNSTAVAGCLWAAGLLVTVIVALWVGAALFAGALR